MSGHGNQGPRGSWDNPWDEPRGCGQGGRPWGGGRGRCWGGAGISHGLKDWARRAPANEDAVRLEERLAALERRLAELEGRQTGPSSSQP